MSKIGQFAILNMNHYTGLQVSFLKFRYQICYNGTWKCGKNIILSKSKLREDKRKENQVNSLQFVIIVNDYAIVVEIVVNILSVGFFI